MRKTWILLVLGLSVGGSRGSCMIGIRALFSFLGMVLGLVAGFRWGAARGWLEAVAATAGGVFGGGIVGYLFGYLLEASSDTLRLLSDRVSSRHRMLGEAVRWSSLVVMIALVIALSYALIRGFTRQRA